MRADYVGASRVNIICAHKASQPFPLRGCMQHEQGPDREKRTRQDEAYMQARPNTACRPLPTPFPSPACPPCRTCKSAAATFQVSVACWGTSFAASSRRAAPRPTWLGKGLSGRSTAMTPSTRAPTQCFYANTLPAGLCTCHCVERASVTLSVSMSVLVLVHEKLH